MPSVTMTLEELDEIRARERTAIARTVELEAQLVAAKQADPTGEDRIAKLNDMCRALMTVARFAVANLPPETIKGWPHVLLVGISIGLREALPDFGIDDESFVSDLRAFANDCATHEERRAAARSKPKAATVELGGES